MLLDKKKIFILLGVLIVVAVVIFAFIQSKNNQGPAPIAGQVQVIDTATTSDEVAPSKNAIDMEAVAPEIVQEAVQIAPGTSLVTKDNIVITQEGTPVKLNVMPSSSEAPKESAPIKIESVPDNGSVVKISVSSAGFSPNTFTVKEGQLVNFTLTSTDSFTHVWLPDDQSLIATALGVAGGETRMKSWNAPKKGTYTFKCDIPGHAARGEVGTMIVE